MSSEQLRLFTLGSLVVALAITGVYFLWSRRRTRRSPERDAVWRELCLRLELVPKPGRAHAASGQLQGIEFSLHDVGSDWILELPLAQPLLPSGVVLISPKAWRIRPPFPVRPLRWDPASTPPRSPAWYANRELPLSKAEASQPFLEEAERAAEAHEPLRVESRRLVHALRSGDSLTVNDVRDAVRALEATAQRWLDVVARHGLPRVTVLPRLPSATSLLRGVLADRGLVRTLLLFNAGIPLTLGVLLRDAQWLFFVLLAGALLVTRSILRKRGYSFARVLICSLVLASTFGAPWIWARSVGRETTPSVISVRDAAQLPHRNAEFFRFDDAALRPELTTHGSGGLIPVVAKDWQPSEQVTVLAVKPPEDPGLGTLGGLTVDSFRFRPDAAVPMALANGFALHPHVRFVDFSTHPDTVVAQLRGGSIFLWSLPNALWLGWVLLQWRRKFLQSRRELGDAGSEERTRTAA